MIVTKKLNRYPSAVSLCVILLICFTGCGVLTQIGEMKTLSKCEFRIGSVTNIRLAGVNFSRIRSAADISFSDMMKLTAALTSHNLPLEVTLNLDVHNPNNRPASLNRLEWKFFIDDLQMIEGVIDQRFQVDGMAVATLPVEVSFNLKEVLTGEKASRILDFAMGLADDNNQSQRLMLRLKPSLMVGNRTVMYPGYIDVRNVFTAE